METNWLIFAKHFKTKRQPVPIKGPAKMEKVDEERGSSDFEVGKRPGEVYMRAEEARARRIAGTPLAPLSLTHRLARYRNWYLSQRKMPRAHLSYEEMRESRMWKAEWSKSNFQIGNEPLENFDNQMENDLEQLENSDQFMENLNYLENYGRRLPTAPLSQHTLSPLTSDTELMAIGTTLYGQLEVKGVEHWQEQLITILPWPLYGSPHPLAFNYRTKILRANGRGEKDDKDDNDAGDDEAKDAGKDGKEKKTPRAKKGAAKVTASTMDVDSDGEGSNGEGDAGSDHEGEKDKKESSGASKSTSFYDSMKDDQMPSPTLGIPSALYISPSPGYGERPADFTWLDGLWTLSSSPKAAHTYSLLPLHRIICVAVAEDVQVWRVSMKSKWNPAFPHPDSSSFTNAEYAALGIMEVKEGQTLAEACTAEVTPLDASLLFTFAPLPDNPIEKLLAWSHPDHPDRQCLIIAHTKGNITCVSFSVSSASTGSSSSGSSLPKLISTHWNDPNYKEGCIEVRREFGFKVGEELSKPKKSASSSQLRPSRLLWHMPISSVHMLSVPSRQASDPTESTTENGNQIGGVVFGAASTSKTSAPASSSKRKSSDKSHVAPKTYWQISMLLTVNTLVMAFDLDSILAAQTEKEVPPSDDEAFYTHPLVLPFCKSAIHNMQISDIHAFCLPVETGSADTSSDQNLNAMQVDDRYPATTSPLFKTLVPFSTPIHGITTGLDGVYKGWRMEPQSHSSSSSSAATAPESASSTASALSGPHNPSKLVSGSLYPQIAPRLNPAVVGMTQPGAWKFILLSQADLGSILEDHDSVDVQDEEDDKEAFGGKETQNEREISVSANAASPSAIGLSSLAQGNTLAHNRGKELKRLMVEEGWPKLQNAEERGFYLPAREILLLNAMVGLYVTRRSTHIVLASATSGRASGNFLSLTLARIDSPSCPPLLLPTFSNAEFPSTSHPNQTILSLAQAKLDEASSLRSEPLPLVLRSISLLLSPLTLSEVFHFSDDAYLPDTPSSSPDPSVKGVKAADFYRILFPSLIRSYYPLTSYVTGKTMYWNDDLWERIAKASRVLTEWLKSRWPTLKLFKSSSSSSNQNASLPPAQRILEDCGIAIGDIETFNSKKRRRQSSVSATPKKSDSSTIASPRPKSSSKRDNEGSSVANEGSDDDKIHRPLLSSLLLLTLRLRALCLLRHICTSVASMTCHFASQGASQSKTSSSASMSFPTTLASLPSLKTVLTNVDRHVLAHWAVLCEDIVSSPLWTDDSALTSSDSTVPAIGPTSFRDCLPEFAHSLGGDILKILQKSLPAASPATNAAKTLDTVVKAKQDAFKENIGFVSGLDGLESALASLDSNLPPFPTPASLSALLPIDKPPSCAFCLSESPSSTPNVSAMLESAMPISSIFAAPTQSLLGIWCPHDATPLRFCASSGLSLPSLDLEPEIGSLRLIENVCPICSSTSLKHSQTSSLPPWVPSQCPFCLI